MQCMSLLDMRLRGALDVRNLLGRELGQYPRPARRDCDLVLDANAEAVEVLREPVVARDVDTRLDREDIALGESEVSLRSALCVRGRGRRSTR